MTSSTAVDEVDDAGRQVALLEELEHPLLRTHEQETTVLLVCWVKLTAWS